ncbi:MAG: recombinase family protein [Blautia hansenii]
MICYVKLMADKTKDSIIEKCSNLGVLSEQIIWDQSVLQKQANTLYSKLKVNLLRKKETLIIDTLTSIGKNHREISKELFWFIENQVPLIVLDIPTTYNKEHLNLVNQTIFEIYKQLAQKEIEHNKSCQKEGIAKAKECGKQLGRSKINYPDNWIPLYNKWKNKEINSKQFIELSGLKKGTFYNLVKQYEKECAEIATSKLA